MFRSSIIAAVAVAGLLFTPSSVTAGFKLSATSVTGSGSYNRSVSLLTDGVLPGEGTGWNGLQSVYWNGSGTGVNFTFDYGSLYQIEDVLFSFDNNDSYIVEHSTDNVSWNRLAYVARGDGEINWGMDTGTGIDGHAEYIDRLNFSPVTARYLRIYAGSGDNLYSLGEFEAYGSNLAAVPEPTSLALFGLAGLVGVGFRRRRASTSAV